MTGKADFTEEEWELVSEGPPSAGLIVVTAQRGGVFRETFAIGKAYTEARRLHGSSQLLDEMVGARYERAHTRYRSAAASVQVPLRVPIKNRAYRAVFFFARNEE